MKRILRTFEIFNLTRLADDKKTGIYCLQYREALQFDWAIVPNDLSNYPFMPCQDKSDFSEFFCDKIDDFVTDNCGPLFQSFLLFLRALL